jgi:glycosyltransferase involved in cell wall biosynthesis
VVVPSRVLERVALDVWRQPASRVRYLPNGVDLERFRPAPRRDGEAASREADVVVGTVGHFRPEKNQAMLVEAFARCRHRPRARLVLVGDGPHLAEVRDRARALGLDERVRFAGPTADTSGAYGEMDVFALSSRTEQMPLVVLEAMACGLAVVSPDVGDVQEMVSEENRPLIVAKDDPDALAAALDRAIGDAELRLRAGRSNRKRCEDRFELERCLGAHLELYREVLEGGPPVGAPPGKAR